LSSFDEYSSFRYRLTVTGNLGPLEVVSEPDSAATTAVVDFPYRVAALLRVIRSDDRATIPVKIMEYFIAEL
jgi:hypothetical protein